MITEILNTKVVEAETWDRIKYSIGFIHKLKECNNSCCHNFLKVMDKMKTSIFTTVRGNKTTSIYLIYLSADLSILFPSVKIQKIQFIIGCREQKIICIIHFDYKRIMYYIYCMCLYWQNSTFLDIFYKIERKVIPYWSFFKANIWPSTKYDTVYTHFYLKKTTTVKLV